MHIKKTKKTVTASTCDSVTLSDGSIIKNKEEAKKWLFYKIEQDTADYGQPMWNKEDKEDLAKLESCFGKLDKDTVTSCNSSKNYDAAQKHIKAAIDILAKCGKDDIIAKDNIANLSVVMFDLMGDK